MLFLFEYGTTPGRCGMGGAEASPLGFVEATLLEEPLVWQVEGGVELPRIEFKVEDDFVVGTVPLDSFEESLVRKLAFERRRSSLKKGMSSTADSMMLRKMVLQVESYWGSVLRATVTAF